MLMKEEPMKMADPKIPRHINENFRLAVAHLKAESAWIKETIKKVTDR